MDFYSCPLIILVSTGHALNVLMKRSSTDVRAVWGIDQPHHTGVERFSFF